MITPGEQYRSLVIGSMIMGVLKKILWIVIGIIGFLALSLLFVICSSMYNSGRALYYVNPSATIKDSRDKGAFYKELRFLTLDTLRMDTLAWVPDDAWLESQIENPSTKSVNEEVWVAVVSFRIYQNGNAFEAIDQNHLPAFTTNLPGEFTFSNVQRQTNRVYLTFDIDRHLLPDTLAIQTEKSNQIIRLLVK